MTNYESISLILTSLSILTGPIIGIRLQKYFERKKDDEDKQKRVFFTLMATRMERLGHEHVKALNSISLAFHTHDKKSREQKVLNKWIEYLTVLGDYQENNVEKWNTKRDTAFTNLLYEISQCLGYAHSQEDIKKECYSPIAHGTLEQNQLDINKGLAEIVLNKRPLWVCSTFLPSEEDKEKKEKKL